jgi:hypothetical protein
MAKALSWPERKLIKAKVIERYGIDQPSGGHEFDQWCDAVAEELGLGRRDIRRMILDYTQGYLNDVQSHAKSAAQRAADTLGATLVKALETINKGMSANKTRMVVIGKGEDARVEKYEVPDWGARLTASKQAVLVHGAEAPKQVEVNQRVLHAHLSDEEIHRQLQELTAQIATQLDSPSRGVIEVAASPSISGGVEGPNVGARLLLLDDRGDRNRRRAKRKAAQAVPKGDVHSEPD